MAFQQEVKDDQLTGKIIGCAIDVHKELGPHQPEHLYREGLCVVLEDEGLEYEREYEVEITLRGRKIGTGFVDIMVEDEVALELKAVKKTTKDHYNQLGRNVHASGASRGLLLNFGETTLSTRRWVNSRLKKDDEEAEGTDDGTEDKGTEDEVAESS
ncbi:GxxExxY protein [Persicimonas caeni]|uniref:GxxExxY protein n=1 Tax=Persicimonas caeni TaxID=2292766 RepID=A0A4Y6PYX3_PERCE|nr:GxxExxY protein [Persicimonas caeni]QDG53512.1 GxxExxY protein [Persicimonas caeni]QED34733.1 GxxExxY protein [Persicimonas caeni]